MEHANKIQVPKNTEDLTGKKFGLVTVEKYLGTPPGRRGSLWQCRCACGKELVRRGDQAKTRPSCGAGICKLSKKVRYPQPGEKFGMLTAVEFSHSGGSSGGLYWVFRCDCGTEVRRRWIHVKRGECVDCGCMRATKFVKTRYESEDRSLIKVRQLLHGYRNNAKNRGLDFSLSEKQFYYLLMQNCFYCGSPPRPLAYRRATKILKAPAEVMLNGIDRWDSHNGYTKENCVPCCKTCNYAKRSMSGEDYLAWFWAGADFAKKMISCLEEKRKAVEQELHGLKEQDNDQGPKNCPLQG